MVRCDGIDYDCIFLILLGNLNTKLYVRSLSLSVNSLTNIMQETCTLSHTYIFADFCS